MLSGRLSRYLSIRIALLAAANVVVLAAIAVQLRAGGSLAIVVRSLLFDAAPVLLAGLGMTAILMTGAIDLSIASIIAVAGTVLGVLVHYQQPPWLCYAACLGTAWVLVVGNGLLVRLTGLPAIIVTLAGLPFYRGVALIVADAAIPRFSGNIPVVDDAYHGPGKFHAGWIVLVTCGAWQLWALAAQTPRKWLALGENEEACRLQGMRPEAIGLSAFVAGGFLIGVAALVHATAVQIIDPARMAEGFELTVIAAVVLGGTRIMGGEGTFLGTLLGATLLHLVEQLLVYGNVNVFFRGVVVGLLILTIIGGDCLAHRRRKRMEELA